MDAQQRRAVLDELRRLGAGRPHPCKPHNFNAERALASMENIEALLADMKLTWAYAGAIAKRMHRVLFAYAKKSGLDAETAARDASERAALIADYLGGSLVYLPRGDALRNAVRDSEAYHRHGGRNTDTLAREYGMTTTEFHELLARERKRRVGLLQGRLFDDLTAQSERPRVSS